MLKKAVAGASPIEITVFDLQDKLEAASKLAGRPAAIEALLAVTEFLSAISGPGERHHQRPINALISALMSLDDGHVAPLLEPVCLPYRARSSVSREGGKAMAVFVAKRLRDAGLDTNDAYEKVALVCRKAGMTPLRKGARDQKSEMTARTVRGWCAAISEDEVIAEDGCKSRAGRQFHQLMSGTPLLRGATTPDKLLAALRHFLATSTA